MQFLATLVLVLLSFLVAYSNLESLFFSALGRKVFLGHSWMRELINHLVLLLTLKGIQSSLLYLLSAGKMSLLETPGISFIAKVRYQIQSVTVLLIWRGSLQGVLQAWFSCFPFKLNFAACFQFCNGKKGEKCWNLGFDKASSSELQCPLLRLYWVPNFVWFDILR